MKETFAKMDINNDGHIDKDEMYIFITKLIIISNGGYHFMTEEEIEEKSYLRK